MDIKWINHPAMKKIDARKLALLVDLANQSKGLSAEKALPLLMSTNAKMQSLGLNFSSEESDLLIEILSNDMSVADKQKIDVMKQMIAKQK